MRELESIIKRAIAYCKNNLVEEKHIQFTQKSNISEKKRKRKTDYTFDEMLRALKKNKGNITKTAKELGMSRNSFYRMKKKMKDKISGD